MYFEMFMPYVADSCNYLTKQCLLTLFYTGQASQWACSGSS